MSDIFEAMEPRPVHSYATLIKAWVGSWVYGPIFGIQYAICGNTKMDCAVNGMTGDTVVEFSCTKLQYDKFSELVKSLYPDVCVFDYQYEDLDKWEKE